MRVGIFDSGLGGLTVVKEISKLFKGAEIFYIADTEYAPYGEKSKEEILKHSLCITKYLIENHNIEALIVACNTATSAAIKELRAEFKDLIVIGTEPGIKPAINLTKTNSVGVLATSATLKGQKYQCLVNDLAILKEIRLFEQACPGLVEQIENGMIEDIKTHQMLKLWLEPMKENGVDTIVLGCTHYPLVADIIRDFMGKDINLIETGFAIAKRLDDLSSKKGHINNGDLDIKLYYTGEINLKMVDLILDKYTIGGKIKVRDINE